VGTRQLARHVWHQIGDDRLLVWAAAVAYSWLVAIFPFLLFLLALVPYLPIDRAEVIAELNEGVRQALPREAADTLMKNVTDVLGNRREGFVSLGILLAVWFASGGMAMTMSALNRCYEVDHDRPLIRQRGIAILLTLAVATLVLGVLLLLPVGTLATNWLTRWGRWNWLRERGVPVNRGILIAWEIARWALAIFLLLVTVNVVYHFGPKTRHRYRFLTPGTLFTVAAWIALGLGFRLYVNRFGGYGATYGAIGGVILLLFIFYLDALVLLVGAEINSEVDIAMTALAVDPEEEDQPEPDLQSGPEDGDRGGTML
jgi:membrane protein